MIACGGGGIPVIQSADGSLTGVGAVIDKDRTSALLAHSLEARLFLLCTSVDAIFTGWGTPAQRRLDRIATAAASSLLQAGEFGSGSMAPKVEAALDYMAESQDPSRRAVIGRLEHLPHLLEGTSGTSIGDFEP